MAKTAYLTQLCSQQCTTVPSLAGVQTEYLILLLAKQGLVGVDELQIGGGGDVDMAPVLGKELLAELLHTLMEQHTQLWHLSADLHKLQSNHHNFARNNESSQGVHRRALEGQQHVYAALCCKF